MGDRESKDKNKDKDKDNKELKTALAAIEKEFGKGLIMSLGRRAAALDVEALPAV